MQHIPHPNALHALQVAEDPHATGKVAHAFISLMFGPCTRSVGWAAEHSDSTPLPCQAGTAQQCFQSPSSSLWHHLSDTASPVQGCSPGSGSSSLADMQLDSLVPAPGPSHATAPAQAVCRMSDSATPSVFPQSILDEASTSPALHDFTIPHPKLPSCKRRLFKG